MFGFGKKRVSTITIPHEDEIDWTSVKTIYIRIHDYEKLSPEDRGRVLASYVRANKLEGYPDFERSKCDVFAFVVKKPQSQIDIEAKEREARQRDLDRRVLELVRVELVDAKWENS